MKHSDSALLQTLFSTQTQRFTLANGLRVLFRQDRSAPVISAQVWASTGSIHEGALLGCGLSHFVEHMLFKGTARRHFADISADVHKAGGYVNAYTTFDHTTYYIDAPAENSHLIFDVLSDITLHSTMPENEFASERDVILREIDMGRDDPDRRLLHSLFTTAFSAHPYRHPIIGHRALFETITRDELWQYYQNRYAPNNLTLIVVGDLEAEQVEEMAEQYFSAVPMRRVPPPHLPSEPRQLALRQGREYGDFQITRGALAYKIPALTHSDAPTLELIANALGAGDSSVLWQRLREEQKLVHHIDATAWNPSDPGLFYISYVCDPDKREAAEAAIRAEVQRLHKNSLPQSVIDKARRQAFMGEVNARRTMSGQAARIGTAEVVIGEPSYAESFFKNAAKVTPEAARAVIQKYLHDEQLTLTSLEPEKIKSTAVAKNKAPVSPSFSLHTLSNGVRILMQPSKTLPKVHLRAVMLGGPLYEAAGLRGQTELLSTLLTKDTQKRTAAQVAETIDSIGGSMREFAGNNTFGLSLESLSSDVSVLIDLLDQALLHPLFNEAVLDIEKEAQIAGILEDDDEILDYGRRRIRQKFFGDYPMCNEAVGTPETVQAITLADLQAHRDKLICGSNLVLSIAGDFDPDAMQTQLEKIFTAVPSGKATPAAMTFDKPATTGEHQLTLPREQAVLLQAFPDYGIRDEAFIVGELTDEILSGMSSQLFARVREEKGMAYYVGACRVAGIDASMFTLYAGTSPDLAEAVWKEFDLEMQRLRNAAFLEGEIERCKNRLKAQRVLGFQTMGARTMNTALNVIYGFPVDYSSTYNARMDAVTPEQIVDFATTMLDPDKSLRLTVAPSEK